MRVEEDSEEDSLIQTHQRSFHSRDTGKRIGTINGRRCTGTKGNFKLAIWIGQGVRPKTVEVMKCCRT